MSNSSNATPLILPGFAEPWYAKPFRFADLPKAAEKVWACLRYLTWKQKAGIITISDRLGAQWCSANLGVHVGRRCFQKGLKQLQDIGAIQRLRSHGRRLISIAVNLAAPKPKPAPKPKAEPKPAASAPAPAAPTQPARPEPTVSPEEARLAAEQLKALLARVHAQELDDQANAQTHDPAPHPTTHPRWPRLVIPEDIRLELEEKERRRRAAELARLRAIAADRRTADQQGQLNALAAELEGPGSPPAPSGP